MIFEIVVMIRDIMPQVIVMTFLALLVLLKCLADVAVMTRRGYDRKKIKYLNSLPVAAGLIPLLSFSDDLLIYYRNLLLTRTSNGVDPRVLAGGLSLIIVQIMASLIVFLFFYTAWIALRVVHDRLRRSVTR